MLLCNIEDMEMGGMVRYRVKVNEYETKPGIGGGLVCQRDLGSGHVISGPIRGLGKKGIGRGHTNNIQNTDMLTT